MNKIGYNERTWAIDLISEINQILSTKKLGIKHAGGEHTLNNGGRRLFPDVLLFSDQQGLSVLQGWELKMPDTSITDVELLANAESKARQLGLNSFLVWNVNEAALFVQNIENQFVQYHHWEPLNINRRDEVHPRQSEWKALLKVIISDINRFFNDGNILSQVSVVEMSEHLFADIVSQYAEGVANKINTACQKDAVLNAEIDEWWSIHKNEHEQSARAYHILAQNNIVSWLNRILFAHYLKPFADAAKQIDDINETTSIQESTVIFENISSQCDFMNIFKPALAQTCISEDAWQAIVAINVFFAHAHLEDLDQGIFHKLVERALLASRRKIAGQFPTPQPLADLLARITVLDKNKNVLDPCCGTGTIARACYQLKCEFGVDAKIAIATTWAADKFSFPLQLASIALSHPEAMGEIIRVFQHDIFGLSLPKSLTFTDPESGAQTIEELPKVHAIVSNLPFVRFETLAQINPEAKAFGLALNAGLGNNSLTAKVDLYAYAALKIWDILEDDGKAGIIVSNAWLGASWGATFRAALLRYFKIDSVVISGAGRWFENADVVTTILCLSKRAEIIQEPTNTEDEITFVKVLQPIESWNSRENIKEIAGSVLLKKSKDNLTLVCKRSMKQITDLEVYGIGWSAMFSGLSWFDRLKDKLCPVSNVFSIARGERRGWDAMFYPDANHGIEARYIQPVLKTARTIDALIAKPDAEAFCCSEDLSVMGSGARNWVRRYEGATNNIGKPLTESLKRAGHHWYEMKAETMADLVLSMNWDKRLFVARLEEPAFVNQRLIRFTVREGVNVSLIHALLNTTLSLFLIESVGFGKGLGALDLNATNIKNKLHILDPSHLNQEQVHQILKAFEPLLKRNVMSYQDELKQTDRQHFDKVVLETFSLGDVQQDISDALLTLVEMRQAVRNG